MLVPEFLASRVDKIIYINSDVSEPKKKIDLKKEKEEALSELDLNKSEEDNEVISEQAESKAEELLSKINEK